MFNKTGNIRPHFKFQIHPTKKNVYHCHSHNRRKLKRGDDQECSREKCTWLRSLIAIMSLLSVQIRKRLQLCRIPSMAHSWGILRGLFYVRSLQFVKRRVLDLGAWTFPDKVKHSPISLSVGKSKTDTFDTVMINMNVVQTLSIFWTLCEV